MGQSLINTSRTYLRPATFERNNISAIPKPLIASLEELGLILDFVGKAFS